MSTCKACIRNNRTRCNHLKTQCSVENCLRKSFKNGFCSNHIPKINKLPDVPPDPQIEIDRKLRIQMVDAKMERKRELRKRQEQRIRDSTVYGEINDAALNAFYEKCRIEDEMENENIDREFQRTYDYFQSRNHRRSTPVFTSFDDDFRKTPKARKHESRDGPKKTKRQSSDDSSSDEEEERKSRSEQPQKKKTGLESFFELLGIEPTTDVSAIRYAYKRAAIKLHPDKNIGRDTTEDFQNLQSAYEQILSTI